MSSAASFTCSVCLEVAAEPVVTRCGHLFCWLCLFSWAEHEHRARRCVRCPACKGGIDLDSEDEVRSIFGTASESKCKDGSKTRGLGLGGGTFWYVLGGAMSLLGITMFYTMASTGDSVFNSSVGAFVGVGLTGLLWFVYRIIKHFHHVAQAYVPKVYGMNRIIKHFLHFVQRFVPVAVRVIVTFFWRQLCFIVGSTSSLLVIGWFYYWIASTTTDDFATVLKEGTLLATVFLTWVLWNILSRP